MNSDGRIFCGSISHHVFTFDCGLDNLSLYGLIWNFMEILMVQVADWLDHQPISYEKFSKGMWKDFMLVYQKVFILLRVLIFGFSARVNP